jgi:hypothetical protein
MELIDCPNCDGHGYNDGPGPHSTDCPRCNACGKIYVHELKFDEIEDDEDTFVSEVPTIPYRNIRNILKVEIAAASATSGAA